LNRGSEGCEKVEKSIAKKVEQVGIHNYSAEVDRTSCVDRKSFEIEFERKE